MLLTVIIPTRASNETKPYVEACARSIRETAPWCEIVVATNGTHCLDLDVPADVVYFRKQGQCNAVNEVAQNVGSKYILVSNDDMIYSPGWANFLMDSIDEHLCVSPTLVEPYNPPTPFYWYDCGRTIDEFNYSKWLDFVGEMFVGQSDEDGLEDGFNLPFLIDKEIFLDIGGYDTNYDPYGFLADVDLLFTLLSAGVEPKRDSRSLVYHFALGSSSKDRGKEEEVDWWKNNEYFPEKWGDDRPATAKTWYAAKKIDIEKYEI